MATSHRATTVRGAKLAVAGALLGGAAVLTAGQVGAQPAPDDPAPPPAPPPVGAPYVPPVQGADFNNTGQLDFLRDLWNMRNSMEFFQSVSPAPMDPATLPPGMVPPVMGMAPVVSPPPPPGAPPPPAPAPPPVWPPVEVPIPTP